MIRMVIIDDEFFFRRAVKDMPWDAQGIEIAGDANDGQSGLNLILEQRPDIAIVDINMPIYSGLELIRRAKEAGVQCRYIILTGYDEFKYAKEAISLDCSDYLMKPVNPADLMNTVLKEARSILRDRDHERYVQGLTQEKALFHLDREFAALMSPAKGNNSDVPNLRRKLAGHVSYGVGVIAMVRNVSLEYQAALRRHLTELSMEDLIQVFLDDQGRLVVFAAVNSEDALLTLLQRLIEHIETAENVFVPGIGRICGSIEQLPAAYRKACANLRDRLNENSSRPLSANFMMTLARYKSRLEAAAMGRDTDVAEAVLREAYDALSSVNAGYDVVFLTSVDFLNVLLQVMLHKGLDASTPLGNAADLITQLEFCRTVQDFLDWLVTLYRDGILRINAHSSHFSEVTKKVIDYIDVHLSDTTLNIKAISDELYLNYSHICNTFKRDVGMTVNDYIISERMKRAKALIDAGASSIALVSEQVGYNDQSYFSKSFRKYYGASPVNFMQREIVSSQ